MLRTTDCSAAMTISNAMTARKMVMFEVISICFRRECNSVHNSVEGKILYGCVRKTQAFVESGNTNLGSKDPAINRKFILKWFVHSAEFFRHLYYFMFWLPHLAPVCFICVSATSAYITNKRSNHILTLVVIHLCAFTWPLLTRLYI